MFRVETLNQPINPNFSTFNTNTKFGGDYVDTHERNRAGIPVFGECHDDGCDCRLRQSVSSLGSEAAVAATGRGGKRLSSQGRKHLGWPGIESAPAFGGVDSAEHESVDGPGDGRYGGASCGGEIFMRVGVFAGNYRPHVDRDFSQSIDGGWSRGDQSSGGENSKRGRLYREWLMFIGHDSAGVADSVPHGGWAYAEHCGQACWDWAQDQEEVIGQTEKAGERSETHIYEDPFIHAWQGRESRGTEEEAWERFATACISDAAACTGESGTIKGPCPGEISRELGFVSVDVEPDTALDADGVSSSGEACEFMGETGACDRAEQGGQSGGVRAEVDRHTIREGLYYWDGVQKAGFGCRYENHAGGVGALREDDGITSQDGGIRSWRGWEEESPDTFFKEDSSQWNFSKAQGYIAGLGTEHGSQGPPGTCFIGSDNRDNKKFQIRLQQTEGEIIGGVRFKGSGGDSGSKFGASRKRLDGKRSDGGLRKKKMSWMEKWNDGNNGTALVKRPTGYG